MSHRTIQGSWRCSGMDSERFEIRPETTDVGFQDDEAVWQQAKTGA